MVNGAGVVTLQTKNNKPIYPTKNNLFQSSICVIVFDISNPPALPACLVAMGLIMDGLSVVCCCLYSDS